MVAPRHAEGLRDALVFHRRLQGHALRELVDHRALDILPGGLARRIGEAASRLEVRPAPMQGNDSTPRRMSDPGGCMFTTSAAPGYPIGPAPRMIKIVCSSMSSE